MLNYVLFIFYCISCKSHLITVCFCLFGQELVCHQTLVLVSQDVDDLKMCVHFFFRPNKVYIFLFIWLFIMYFHLQHFYVYNQMYLCCVNISLLPCLSILTSVSRVPMAFVLSLHL